MNKTFVLNDNGEIHSSAGNIGPVYGVFFYSDSEDANTLEGTSPVIFDSSAKLEKYLTSISIEEIISSVRDADDTVVIRKFNCLIP